MCTLMAPKQLPMSLAIVAFDHSPHYYHHAASVSTTALPKKIDDEELVKVDNDEVEAVGDRTSHIAGMLHSHLVSFMNGKYEKEEGYVD